MSIVGYKKERYSLEAVTSHIMTHAKNNRYYLSDLKRDNLLFYSVALLTLIYDESIVFKDSCRSKVDNLFVKTRSGPKYKSIYKKNNIFTIIDFKFCNIHLMDEIITEATNSDNISSGDVSIINDLLDSYINYDEWDIIEKLHFEKPYKELKNGEYYTSKDVLNGCKIDDLFGKYKKKNNRNFWEV